MIITDLSSSLPERVVFLVGMLRAVCLLAIFSVVLVSGADAQDLRQALSLFNSGRYQDCYQALSSYLKQNPESGPAYKVLGMTEFMLGEPAKAREHLTTATNLSPKDAEAFYYLGRLYFTADNPLAAAAEFEKALELDPSSVRAENQLGQSFEALGRLHEAEATYLKAIELEQNQTNKSEWPFYNLGLLYFRNGKSRESTVYFRHALECNPSFVNAKIKLAVALTAEQQNDEAEKLLRDAIRIEETNAEAHYRLAILLKKARKQDDSNQQFALFEKYKSR